MRLFGPDVVHEKKYIGETENISKSPDSLIGYPVFLLSFLLTDMKAHIPQKMNLRKRAFSDT